jgi:hypothetical protein
MSGAKPALGGRASSRVGVAARLGCGGVKATALRFVSLRDGAFGAGLDSASCRWRRSKSESQAGFGHERVASGVDLAESVGRQPFGRAEFRYGEVSAPKRDRGFGKRGYAIAYWRCPNG